MAVDLGIAGIGPATRLGSGGFGTVYAAEQLGMSRKVAVKVLSSLSDDPEARRRFERERQALGTVSDHPNIVSVFDWGITSDGKPYLVMEFLAGGTLGRLVSERGPLPADTTAAVGRAIASALAAAHERGVFHRDVKPENILISSYGQPVLCDFGIARLVGASRTIGGGLTASLAHAAPEVISGEEVGAATDVWALGSTLATLLLGRPPFVVSTDDTMPSIIARILTQDAPDLAARGVSPELAAVLQAAMSKDPATRTATAAAFADGLTDAIRINGWNPTPILPVLPQTSEQPSNQSVYDQPTVMPRPSAAGRPVTTDRTPSPVGSMAGTTAPLSTSPKPSRTPWAVAAAAIFLAVAVIGILVGVSAGSSGNKSKVAAGPVATPSTNESTVKPPPSTAASTTGPSVLVPPPTPPTTSGYVVPNATFTPEMMVGSWFAPLSAISVAEGIGQRDAALAKVRNQVPEAQILYSDDYASLTPGYWIVYYPRPFAHGTEAIAFCDSVGRYTNHDCYGRFLSHSALDRKRFCLRNSDGSLPPDCQI